MTHEFDAAVTRLSPARAAAGILSVLFDADDPVWSVEKPGEMFTRREGVGPYFDNAGGFADAAASDVEVSDA